ncbi:MAG TPA: hypothetical protein VF183_02540 [Acidimicrobiales bacterium]
MRTAALIAALVSTVGGLAMTGIWVMKGGARQTERDSPDPSLDRLPTETTHMPVWMLVTHALFAAIMLGLWIVYMFEPDTYDMVPGFNVFLLVCTAALGFVMLRNWLTDRRLIGDQYRFREDIPAEQHFPAAGVFVHGLAGVTTLVLVFLVALGVGVD